MDTDEETTEYSPNRLRNPPWDVTNVTGPLPPFWLFMIKVNAEWSSNSWPNMYSEIFLQQIPRAQEKCLLYDQDFFLYKGQNI